MRPRRPYLLRALHEWITDSGETPHIVVDAAGEGVVVPAPAGVSAAGVGAEARAPRD